MHLSAKYIGISFSFPQQIEIFTNLDEYCQKICPLKDAILSDFASLTELLQTLEPHIHGNITNQLRSTIDDAITAFDEGKDSVEVYEKIWKILGTIKMKIMNFSKFLL